MAQVFDFPTNYEEKLYKADQLIDKGYIDQAICLIEDFIEQSKPANGRELLQKKLLTCYFIKKEFESAELILKVLVVNSQDLSAIAHLSLLYRIEKNEQGLIELDSRCKESLSPYGYKNLQELTAQLKTFYEDYWYRSIEKQINQLTEGCSTEQGLLIISDLYEYSSDELLLFKSQFEMFFKTSSSPLLKTILFELLATKELNWDVSFYNDQTNEFETINTNLDVLNSFKSVLETVNEQLNNLKLEVEIEMILKQQTNLFYQFCFPFVEQLVCEEVINSLLAMIQGENVDFLSQADLSSTNSPIINYTTCKLSQYILSLSSLM